MTPPIATDRPKASLSKLHLCGFKTIRDQVFDPKSLTVFIGPNGAGKSNLISFFRALSFALGGDLQLHLGQSGRAHSWLYEGPAVTQSIVAELEVQSGVGTNNYHFSWELAASDTLCYGYEKYRFRKTGATQYQAFSLCGSGHPESKLRERAEAGESVPLAIRAMLRSFMTYQFHNTSFTSRMRQAWGVDDGRRLKEDGANLAAFLFRLRSATSLIPYYQRIVQHIRLAIPFFDEFHLDPDPAARPPTILLQWKEKGSDIVFGPHQASDGMLRYMALISLLLQPAEDLPSLLILDEPELGLHPQAIRTVASFIKSASRSCQVILATQSPQLVNEFAPEDVVVVERHHRETTFRRLSSDTLEEWLDAYSLADLWEKNVIGGRPT